MQSASKAFRNNTAPNKTGYLLGRDISWTGIQNTYLRLPQCLDSGHTNPMQSYSLSFIFMPHDSYVGPINRQVEYFARVGCVGQSARLFDPLPIAALCRNQGETVRSVNMSQE